MALVIVGILLMVGPWVWRDYSTAPNNREAWLFRNDPGRILEKFRQLILPSGQTKHWDDDSLMSGWQGTVVKVDLKPRPQNLKNNSSFDALLNHVVDSSAQSVLYLPVNNRALLSIEYFFEHHPPMPYEKLCCELERFVRNTPYWWPDWSGEIPSTSYIPFGLTLLLISIGLGTVWKSQQWIGLFPLLALFAHVFIFALMKRSGGRFLVVTDWASAMYYGIGLSELSIGFLAWLNVDVLTSFDQRKHRDSKHRWHNKWIYGLSILVILLIGAAPPAVEKLIPEQYTSEQKQSRLNALLEDRNGFLNHQEREIWESMLSSGGSVMFGRALYPNFYQSGTAKEDANELARQKGSRIEFYLVGTERHYLEVPTNDWLVDFPHGSDVVVLGCSTDVVSVAIYSSDGESPRDIFWRDPLVKKPVTCPLSGE